ncbi:uncharacterized protein LOC120651212 [Panicum virgatum]|uniref:Uncharacterized protein n=1 Tax=Panicum virgatum TaxID=38727 RepID=A0A8T0XDU3_PANVG|nr:uncharacterized protein LOC120651212 [Panicum virgatum]KAG2656968.1 hypothetical protein PVAP13_1KG120500 [Panicum virgatum]
MASGSAGTPPGAAYGYSSRHSSYATAANRQLARQRSMPAALAAAFAPFGGGGREWPRTRRLGDGGGERAPAPGGVVGRVARAMWAWIGRGRRKVAVMGRSASSSPAKVQYGHEEYAQNFDEGATASEPENLPRSFSARYARQGTRDGARWGRRRPPP